MSTGPDVVWATHSDGTVTRLNVTTGGTTEIQAGRGPAGIAASDDAVWVANSDDRSITRIDPVIAKVSATVPVGGRPVGIAFAPDGSVWVTIQGP